MLRYKAVPGHHRAAGIGTWHVDDVCGVGTVDANQCVERGLTVCETCGVVGNADWTGGNLRENVLHVRGLRWLRIGVPVGWHSKASVCSSGWRV